MGDRLTIEGYVDTKDINMSEFDAKYESVGMRSQHEQNSTSL